MNRQPARRALVLSPAAGSMTRAVGAAGLRAQRRAGELRPVLLEETGQARRQRRANRPSSPGGRHSRVLGSRSGQLWGRAGARS